MPARRPNSNPQAVKRGPRWKRRVEAQQERDRTLQPTHGLAGLPLQVELYINEDGSVTFADAAAQVVPIMKLLRRGVDES